jgi:hypothetical protein
MAGNLHGHRLGHASGDHVSASRTPEIVEQPVAYIASLQAVTHALRKSPIGLPFR